MNIHQLLSANLSSPQTPSQGVLGGQESPNGLFRQALLHASGTQTTSSLSPQAEADSRLNDASLQARLTTTAQGLSDALNVDVNNIDIENLTAALEALGIDISESDLSAVLAQLQTPDAGITTAALTLGDAESSTGLDEIASRLALMASFDDSRSLQSAPSAALETVAEQLNINQTEAAQLVSALSALMAQNQAAQNPGTQSLAIDSTRLPSVDTLPVDLSTTPRPYPGNFLTQVSTSSASPQVSSEALMGALLTLEGVTRNSPAGEQLFTSPSLSANQPPLTSSQAAQGFAPTVPPTQASLSTPVTSNAWPQQLGQQLVQISQRGGEQHVQMQLHPAELGPLSISLKFSEQGAQAHFLSAHAQVRQVLEQAIPQLREALAEQGISLGETSVGEQRDPNAQAFAQSGGKQGIEAGGDNGDVGLDETTPALSAESSPLILDGRVDLYA